MTSAIRWKKRLNSLAKALIDYDRKRHVLVMTYGRALPGQKNKVAVSPVMTVGGKEEKDPNWLLYTEELNRLNDSEIELDVQPIPLIELDEEGKGEVCPACGAKLDSQMKMTIEDLMLLSSFVEG